MKNKLINEVLYSSIEEAVKDVMTPDNVALRKSLRHVDTFLDTLNAMNPGNVSQDHFEEFMRYMREYLQPNIKEFIQKWKEAHQGGGVPPQQQKVAESK